MKHYRVKNKNYAKAKAVERHGGQWRFAHVLGVHETVVSRVFNGHQPLNKEEASRWANAIGCGLNEFFSEIND